MSVPNLSHLVAVAAKRWPSAWAKCLHPHDDGEFCNRFVAMLHFDYGYEEAGLNGKRGNPRDLSKDALNWAGEGNNYDPTRGNADCQIVDFIVSHESPSANGAWIYSDPDGPGAWIQPDASLLRDTPGEPEPSPAPQPTQPTKSYEDAGGDRTGDRLGHALFRDYATAGNAPDEGMGIWIWRTAWDIANEGLTPDESIQKHRAEWLAVLGVPR